MCLVIGESGAPVLEGEKFLRTVRRGHVAIRFAPEMPQWLKDELRG